MIKNFRDRAGFLDGWDDFHIRATVRAVFNIDSNTNSVVFVGYAAQGTLARRIISRAKRERIFGEDILRACRYSYH